MVVYSVQQRFTRRLWSHLEWKFGTTHHHRHHQQLNSDSKVHNKTTRLSTTETTQL